MMHICVDLKNIEFFNNLLQNLYVMCPSLKKLKHIEAEIHALCANKVNFAHQIRIPFSSWVAINHHRRYLNMWNSHFTPTGLTLI